VRARATLGLAAIALVVTACGASSGKSLADLTGASGTGLPTTTSTTRPVATSRPTTSVRATTSTTTAVSTSWVPAAGNLTGMASECGNVSLVSARPGRDTVIASVALHGLWASTTADKAWTVLGQGGGATISNRGSTIVYDPVHPGTWWESGIYNGGGVYRTDDDGATFQQLGTLVHVDAVSVDLFDPARRTLLAGIHEQTGLMRSHDGGQTWSKVSASLPPDVGFTSAPFVIDARTFLVGTNHAENAGVFRTTDDGATWAQVFKGAVIGQPLLTTAGALYWVVDSVGGMIKSTDGGATWQTAARAGTINPLAPNLVEVPGGGIAAVGNQAVIVTRDDGATWTKIGPTMPYRPVGMTFSPSRQAFYIWYFTCDPNGNNAVPADAIMQLDLNKG
jgi:hypothetical protein